MNRGIYINAFLCVSVLIKSELRRQAAQKKVSFNMGLFLTSKHVCDLHRSEINVVRLSLLQFLGINLAFFIRSQSKLRLSKFSQV